MRPIHPPGRAELSPRHDRDDRVRLVIDANRFAKNFRIANELCLPEVVTQDDYEVVAPPVLVTGKQAAEQRLDVQHFEIIGRHKPDLALFGLTRAVTDGDILSPGVADDQLFESAV